MQSCVPPGRPFTLRSLLSLTALRYGTKFVPTVQDAYRAEGVRAFWRGMTATQSSSTSQVFTNPCHPGVLPPLLSVTAVRTASFTIYQAAKYKYAASIEKITGENALDIANAANRGPCLSTILCFGLSGATAGSIVTILACEREQERGTRGQG